MDTVARRLRRWWQVPPRPGLQRLISPWEYRHLRLWGVTRLAGGGVATVAGVTCLAYRSYGWAIFFLIIGSLDLAGGYWYLTITRGDSART